MLTGVEAMAKSRPYQDSLLVRLKDPQEAAAYLGAALEEGDQEVFWLALCDVAEARGRDEEHLYRALSEKGDPELASLNKLLHALGLRLAIEVDRQADTVS
jgi:probable addiction module antidote protein